MIRMAVSEGEIKRKGESLKVSEWKYSRVSDPDEMDALSDLLSDEIDREFEVLERKLADYWKRKDD